MIQQYKIDAVEKFSKETEGKSLIFVNYEGINVADFTEIRGELRGNQAFLKVLKNSYLKRVLKKHEVNVDDKILAGMTVTAVVDVDNFSACGKSILEAEKKKKVIIKGGCFEGQYIDADVVRKYASIPSKKELYGMLAGSLNSIIGKIAFVLNEVKEKKEEEKK